MSNRVEHYTGEQGNGHTSGHSNHSFTSQHGSSGIPANRGQNSTQPSENTSWYRQCLGGAESLVQKFPAVAIGAAVAGGLAIGYWVKRK